VAVIAVHAVDLRRDIQLDGKIRAQLDGETCAPDGA